MDVRTVFQTWNLNDPAILYSHLQDSGKKLDSTPEPFCEEFACYPCACVGSLQVLWVCFLFWIGCSLVVIENLWIPVKGNEHREQIRPTKKHCDVLMKTFACIL